MQREANRLFGFTAKQTLDYAQQLYEKKCLTYPRTDSQYLTDDMQPTAESIVSGLWPLLPFAAELDISPQFGRVLNSKKVSDHHAIIPTMEFVQKGFDGLTEGEKKNFSPLCAVSCFVPWQRPMCLRLSPPLSPAPETSLPPRAKPS
ncbi:DNA topoisomerase [Sellimonas intestinalis]|uniref:DNA topoisomerase n=1 Tax=Sellimonas intestinalis TaxID=1653434 RepID=UPI00399A2936